MFSLLTAYSGYLATKVLLDMAPILRICVCVSHDTSTLASAKSLCQFSKDALWQLVESWPGLCSNSSVQPACRVSTACMLVVPIVVSVALSKTTLRRPTRGASWKPGCHQFIVAEMARANPAA